MILPAEPTWDPSFVFTGSSRNEVGLAGLIRSEEHLRPREEDSPPPQLSTEDFCSSLAAAAQASDIPVAFFARLIWQESRFKVYETSSAGAQGIAQFMPQTAAEIGLNNPFDPLEALPASARFLHRLRKQFGNLGLAAAAYNAGSGRVLNWLARREALPAETRAYVLKITGSPAESWALESKTLKVLQQLPEQAACQGTAGLSREKTAVALSVRLAPAISSIIKKARREGAQVARASAKAAAASKDKLRTASIELKKHNQAQLKSALALRSVKAKRRAITMALASE